MDVCNVLGQVKGAYLAVLESCESRAVQTGQCKKLVRMMWAKRVQNEGKQAGWVIGVQALFAYHNCGAMRHFLNLDIVSHT